MDLCLFCNGVGHYGKFKLALVQIGSVLGNSQKVNSEFTIGPTEFFWTNLFYFVNFLKFFCHFINVNFFILLHKIRKIN